MIQSYMYSVKSFRGSDLNYAYLWLWTSSILITTYFCLFPSTKTLELWWSDMAQFINLNKTSEIPVNQRQSFRRSFSFTYRDPELKHLWHLCSLIWLINFTELLTLSLYIVVSSSSLWFEVNFSKIFQRLVSKRPALMSKLNHARSVKVQYTQCFAVLSYSLKQISWHCQVKLPDYPNNVSICAWRPAIMSNDCSTSLSSSALSEKCWKGRWSGQKGNEAPRSINLINTTDKYGQYASAAELCQKEAWKAWKSSMPNSLQTLHVHIDPSFSVLIVIHTNEWRRWKAGCLPLAFLPHCAHSSC